MEQPIMFLFSAPFGVAETNPISGIVASALKFVLLNKGFQQIQGMVIYLNPVLRDSLGIEGQEFRCQVFSTDPAGKMRNPVLLAAKWRFFSLVDLFQPMKESGDLSTAFTRMFLNRRLDQLKIGLVDGPISDGDGQRFRHIAESNSGRLPKIYAVEFFGSG